MGPAGAGPGAQGWAPPAPAQERRAPTIGPALCVGPVPAQAPAFTNRQGRPQLPRHLHPQPQPFREGAFPAPNNLWETRLPIKQTFIQVVPPVSPSHFPVLVLVIVDALEVVLCLVPGLGYARPQAGRYQVVQRGYELLVDHESFRRCSVIVENLAVKLAS